MRFYTGPMPLTEPELWLEADEAHHLLHVMRAKVGDPVTLFNGLGHVGRAEIQELQRARVRLRVVEHHIAMPSTGCRLTLAVALPKGDRQTWLVEKATELGVARIIPLVTQRGVAQPTPSAIRRLERTVIQACKQSGRDFLMAVDSPRPLVEIDRTVAPGVCWLADPAAAVSIGARYATDRRQAEGADRELCVAVGPEGGFTPDELAWAAAHDWHAVMLGPHTLRVETAAVAVAAILVGLSGRGV